MKVTINDIARLAGVSKATVSRVLNQSKPVSKTAQESVLKVIEQTGYRPSPTARGLSLKRSNLIGIVIPDLSNPVFAEIISGIESIMRDTEFALVIAATDFDEDKKKDQVQMLLNRNIDGLILISDQEHDTKASLGIDETPFVMIGTDTIDKDVPVIKIDNRQAVRAIIQLFVDNKRKKIAMIRGPLNDLQSGKARYAAYEEKMKAMNQFDESLVVSGNYRFEDGYQCMKALLGQDNHIDAVFCANDFMAIGAMRYALERGYKVPEDIAFIGFDDVDLSRMVTPSLTTVKQPFFEKGVLAGQVLMESIKGSVVNPLMVYELPYEIIIRESL